MRDEVDAVVAAWRRERPDLDVRPMEVFSRVSRLSRYLERARCAVLSRHDMERGEFDVLLALRCAPAPHALPAGQLASRTLVSSGTITNRVDCLVQRDLVSPRRAPSALTRRCSTCSRTNCS
jgi:DNA-binding MarR family transcriptional regulator